MLNKFEILYFKITFFFIVVTEAKCKEAKPKCKDTGGTCSVDGETIKCVCKADITYSEQTGCNGKIIFDKCYYNM